jgi:protein required for attachment to host cells
MKQLKTGGWVVIADGSKALFLRNDLNTRDYDLRVVQIREQDNPASRDQGSDRPGRAHSGPGGSNIAYDETDWHQLAEDRFVAELSDILVHKSRTKAFDQVVLVAPPPVLGALREALPADVAAHVLAEIPKTLTNHPVKKIASLIKTELDKL